MDHAEHQKNIVLEGIQFNNTAAKLMSNREYVHAVACLNQVLIGMKSLFEAHGNVVSNVLISQDFQLGEWMTLPDTVVDGEFTSLRNETFPDADSLKHNYESDYIYRHPIYIPEDKVLIHINRMSIDKYSGVAALLSVIAMFNLALAHQLDGMEHSRNWEVSLRKSARLYELANQLASVHDIECGALFLLSVANNLGHVYKTLSCPNKATKFFEHLLCTLLYLTEGCRCEGIPALSGFFRSTHYLSIQDSCAGAA